MEARRGAPGGRRHKCTGLSALNLWAPAPPLSSSVDHPASKQPVYKWLSAAEAVNDTTGPYPLTPVLIALDQRVFDVRCKWPTSHHRRAGAPAGDFPRPGLRCAGAVLAYRSAYEGLATSFWAAVPARKFGISSSAGTRRECQSPRPDRSRVTPARTKLTMEAMRAIWPICHQP